MPPKWTEVTSETLYQFFFSFWSLPVHVLAGRDSSKAFLPHLMGKEGNRAVFSTAAWKPVETQCPLRCSSLADLSTKQDLKENKIWRFIVMASTYS